MAAGSVGLFAQTRRHRRQHHRARSDVLFLSGRPYEAPGRGIDLPVAEIPAGGRQRPAQLPTPISPWRCSRPSAGSSTRPSRIQARRQPLPETRPGPARPASVGQAEGADCGITWEPTRTSSSSWRCIPRRTWPTPACLSPGRRHDEGGVISRRQRACTARSTTWGCRRSHRPARRWARAGALYETQDYRGSGPVAQPVRHARPGPEPAGVLTPPACCSARRISPCTSRSRPMPH